MIRVLLILTMLLIPLTALAATPTTPAGGVEVVTVTVVQHDVAPTLLTARRGRARPKRHPARVERKVIVVEEDTETEEYEEDDEYDDEYDEDETIAVEGVVRTPPPPRKREYIEQERRRARGRDRR